MCMSRRRSVAVRALVVAVYFVASAGLLGMPLFAGHARPAGFSLTHVTVAVGRSASPQEIAAVDLLVREEYARTGVRWQMARNLSSSERPARTQVVIAECDEIAGLLAPEALSPWKRLAPSVSFRQKREGFSIRTLLAKDETTIVIAGNDGRGILYGVGYLLRQMEMSPGQAVLPESLNLSDAPSVPIRSHQIGYRFKNNTYDAWSLPMFEQHIRDLAVFGISGLQVIAPKSDDQESSPLFPAPALETVVGISGLLNKYGLDCELYYPELRKDYTNPSTVADELKDFEDLVKAMPRIDALYVPGGDPGHTPSAPLFALLEKEAALLHRYHSAAKIWVSAQGFDHQGFEEFYRLLRQEQPEWLTGVFFGPQSRDSFETQRANVPVKYKMLFYPDIGHTMHSQFPVPQWDPVFALTEGREPITPRPIDETQIYRHFAPLHTGFVTYSEGVNDDVNKFLWTRLGWSENTTPQETLKEYSRYFLGHRIGRDSSDIFARALFGLEEDWRGSLLTNKCIITTLRLLNRLDAEASIDQRSNWRFESAMYRADYDAYMQIRRRAELRQETTAISELRRARLVGSAAAMNAANRALQQKPVASDLRSKIEELAGDLFRHAGLQLSVTKFGASGIERGANLDHVDIPLNDRIWISKRFDTIRQLPTEAERLSAIADIVNWNAPVQGTLHDDLGQPDMERHLIRGKGFMADPEMYNTAIDGVADRTTEDGWRLSDLDYAETLYETPLMLHYAHLDPHGQYKLRVTYAGEDYSLPLTLIANAHTLIHAARLRRSNPETVEFAIPRSETSNGSLDLAWSRPDGGGGSGRGRQVAETWLLPMR